MNRRIIPRTYLPVVVGTTTASPQSSNKKTTSIVKCTGSDQPPVRQGRSSISQQSAVIPEITS
jgi:hypothetical protein